MLKKFLITLLISFGLSSASFAEIVDYATLYEQTPLSSVKLMHNLDPFQDEDYYNYAWSPYPLFRTSSTLFFKDLEIPLGYYLLTPRKLKNQDCVLFKDNGKVQFIVPVAKTTVVPPEFYTGSVPTPKLTKWQKTKKWLGNKFYSIFRNSKKVPPPKSFIDVVNDGMYVNIKLYFGETCYWMIFRRQKY